MILQTLLRATEVRKDFGSFIDGVVRHRPEFVKRSRDVFAALSIPHLQMLLQPYILHLEYAQENDCSYSGSLRELDLVANAPTLEALRLVLAEELIEYAHEYREDAALYLQAPNRKNHLPYVLHVLIQEDLQGVMGLIVDA